MSILWLRLLSLLSHFFWRLRLLVGISYRAEAIEYGATTSITAEQTKPQHTPVLDSTAAKPTYDPIFPDTAPSEASSHAVTAPSVNQENLTTPNTFEERIATLKGTVVSSPHTSAIYTQTKPSIEPQHTESQNMHTSLTKPPHTHTDTEPEHKEMSNWTFILLALFIFGISIGSFFIN